jgi:hypothetical protein
MSVQIERGAGRLDEAIGEGDRIVRLLNTALKNRERPIADICPELIDDPRLGKLPFPVWSRRTDVKGQTKERMEVSGRRSAVRCPMSMAKQFGQYAREALFSACKAKTIDDRQGLFELA